MRTVQWVYAMYNLIPTYMQEIIAEKGWAYNSSWAYSMYSTVVLSWLYNYYLWPPSLTSWIIQAMKNEKRRIDTETVSLWGM